MHSDLFEDHAVDGVPAVALIHALRLGLQSEGVGDGGQFWEAFLLRRILRGSRSFLLVLNLQDIVDCLGFVDRFAAFFSVRLTH